MRVKDRLEALEFLVTHIIAQTPGLAEAVRHDLEDETSPAPWAPLARQWLSIAEHLPVYQPRLAPCVAPTYRMRSDSGQSFLQRPDFDHAVRDGAWDAGDLFDCGGQIVGFDDGESSDREVG